MDLLMRQFTKIKRILSGILMRTPLSYVIPSRILECTLCAGRWAENSGDETDKILALAELTFWRWETDYKQMKYNYNV